MPTAPDEPVRLRAPLRCWHESLVSARTDPLVALSTGGAFIATERPVPPGTPLFLEIRAEEGANGTAEVDAVAVAAPSAAHRHGHGARDQGEQGFAVRFVGLDARARELLEKLLAQERQSHNASQAASQSGAIAPAVAAAPFGDDDDGIGVDIDDADVDVTDRNPVAERPSEGPALAVEPSRLTATPAPLPPSKSPKQLNVDETQPFARPPGLAPQSFEMPRTQPNEETIRLESDRRAPAPAPSPMVPAQHGPAAADRSWGDAVDETTRWAPARRAESASPPPPPPPPATVSQSPLEAAPSTPRTATPLQTPMSPVGPAPLTQPPLTLAQSPRTPAPLAQPPLTPPLTAPASLKSGIPMPKIASIDVPGGAPLPAIEDTMRWPTAKLRVRDAPDVMPVDPPSAPPPELHDDGEARGAASLDALFGGAAPEADRAPLEAPPDLSFDVAQGPTLAPVAPPLAPIETQPPPPSSLSSSLFGAPGELLGDPDEIPVGGLGSGFGGGFDAGEDVEVTDPNARAPDITAPNEATANSLDGLDVTDEAPATQDDDVDVVEVSGLDGYKDVLGAPVSAAAPTAAVGGATLLDTADGDDDLAPIVGEPIVGSPIESTVAAPPPALPSIPVGAPRPKPNETQPYLTLGGAPQLAELAAIARAATPAPTAFDPFAPIPVATLPPRSSTDVMVPAEEGAEPAAPSAPLSPAAPNVPVPSVRTTAPFMPVWSGPAVTPPPPVDGPLTTSGRPKTLRMHASDLPPEAPGSNTGAPTSPAGLDPLPPPPARFASTQPSPSAAAPPAALNPFATLPPLASPPANPFASPAPTPSPANPFASPPSPPPPSPPTSSPPISPISPINPFASLSSPSPSPSPSPPPIASPVQSANPSQNPFAPLASSPGKITMGPTPGVASALNPFAGLSSTPAAPAAPTAPTAPTAPPTAPPSAAASAAAPLAAGDPFASLMASETSAPNPFASGSAKIEAQPFSAPAAAGTMEVPDAATDLPPPRSPPPLPARRGAAAEPAASLLGNETIAGAGLGWAAAVDEGPVLSLDTPDEAVAEGQIESFFDDMAFQAAESAPRGEPQQGGSWAVQEQRASPPPLPGAARDAVPIGVVDEEDIPVVMGNDLPAAAGAPAPAPATNDPFNGLDWIVGEPGKK